MSQEQSDKTPLASATARELKVPSTLSGEKLILSPESDLAQPEVVNIVERISKIITPYFIVIVGLYLYDDNFLIGILLVAIGIAALLNASTKNAKSLWESTKQFLGLDR